MTSLRFGKLLGNLSQAKSLHRHKNDSPGGYGYNMAEIIPFPVAALHDENADPDIDLLTAVDVAIRDLRDIALALGEERVREQAEACRRMLERAFEAAV